MWRIYDERVHVLRQKHNYFPDLFLWRGRYHQVHSVERCWVRSRRVERRFFQVQCAAGTFELFQDLHEGSWFVRRASLASVPTRAVGRPVVSWR